MDEFYLWRGHHHQVPAFGSWDYYYNNDLPFTQCFESATKQQTAMKGKIRDHVWVVQCDESDGEEFKVARRSPRVVNAVNNSTNKCKPKAVLDEDLYKISPHLIRQVLSKRKKTWGFFYSCLKPACLC